MDSSGKLSAIATNASPPMRQSTSHEDSACSSAQLDSLVASLFEQYSTAICAYVHVLVKDWQLAQELTQEAYLRLYRSRERLPEVDNQRAWVYRIAHNVAISELKRRKRFAWLPWRNTDEEIGLTWIESTGQIDDRTDIEETMRQLPEHYRAPLILYSGHGLSVKEVAQALDLTESAVKVRLHRAREMFRKLYTQSE